MTTAVRTRIRVLIADDHTILREGIRLLLGSQPDIHVVGEASDGRDAYFKVEELHPDVVLMDIGMPVLNGLDATQQIRRTFPNTKVLILTQHDNDEYVYRILQAGASGYVLKRVAGAELVSAIRGVSVDGVMRTLLTRGLVEEAGQDRSSGANLYRTSSYFLERIGVSSLDDLPELAPFLPDLEDLGAELVTHHHVVREIHDLRRGHPRCLLAAR